MLLLWGPDFPFCCSLYPEFHLSTTSSLSPSPCTSFGVDCSPESGFISGQSEHHIPLAMAMCSKMSKWPNQSQCNIMTFYGKFLKNILAVTLEKQEEKWKPSSLFMEPEKKANHWKRAEMKRSGSFDVIWALSPATREASSTHKTFSYRSR